MTPDTKRGLRISAAIWAVIIAMAVANTLLGELVFVSIVMSGLLIFLVAAFVRAAKEKWL